MQVLMLYYGRLFIQTGQMTTGSLVSFILYQSELGDCIRVSRKLWFFFCSFFKGISEVTTFSFDFNIYIYIYAN